MLTTLTKGFTIVEIIVVITVSGILAGILFGPLNSLYLSNTKSLTSVVQLSDIKVALRQMEKSAALGISYAAQSYPDSNSKIWKWNDASGLLSAPLIITANATEKNASGDRALAYNFSSTCTQFPIPMTYNILFYVQDGSLYRRTIKPPITTTCSGNAIEQKTSCTDPSSSTICTANDALLIKGVTGFSIAYYQDSNSPTSTTPASDAAVVTYRSAVITLETTAGRGGAQATASSSLRISLVNA